MGKEEPEEELEEDAGEDCRGQEEERRRKSEVEMRRRWRGR